MAQMGMVVKQGSGGLRIGLQCPHQSGLLYVVPGEASWVCSQDLLHAHALAGFFRELARLQDPRVHDLMQRWGLYYRERPLEKGPEDGDDARAEAR